MYFESAPTLFKAMREGLRTGDVDSLRRAAHSLKSSSASVGVKRVAALSKEIEGLAKANDLVLLDGMIDALAAEHERGANALREMLGMALPVT